VIEIKFPIVKFLIVTIRSV